MDTIEALHKIMNKRAAQSTRELRSAIAEMKRGDAVDRGDARQLEAEVNALEKR